MKKIVLIAFALVGLLVQPCLAQEDLVYNGSFEELTSCPSNEMDFGYAKGWHIFAGTPDLFASCVRRGGALAVPTNYVGTRATFAGTNYVGLSLSLTYGPFSDRTNYQTTEAIYTQIRRPLRVGGRYRLTLAVSLSDSAIFSTDSLFCSLSAEAPIVTKAPKGDSGRFFRFRGSDTYGSSLRVACAGCWHLLEMEFTARQAYTYLSLGLPRTRYPKAAYTRDLAQPVRVAAPSKWSQPSAYYYLDDIRLLEL